MSQALLKNDKLLMKTSTVSGLGFNYPSLDAYLSYVKIVWNFESGAFQSDATGHGYSWGNYYGTPTENSNGIDGHCAYELNGGYSPRWDNPNAVPGSSEPFSMWVWVKPTVQIADTKNVYFFNFWQNYDNLNTYLCYNNTSGTYSMTARLPSGTNCSANQTLSLNDWHLVMMTADPVTVQKLKIYIDGSMIASTDLTSNGSIATQDFHLTRTNNSDPSTFTDWYFDSFVYMKGAALGSGDVFDLWNAGNGRFYKQFSVNHKKLLMR